MSDHDPKADSEAAELFRDWIQAVRADAPQPARWRAAQRKLTEQLGTRQRETIVMKAFRRARSTKTGWTATAAAVAAVMALAFGFSFWNHGRSLAFADVLQQIRTFRPYSCTSTLQDEGKPPFTKRITRLSLSRRREIWPGGQVLVFDLSREPNKILILRPKEKLAFEKTLTAVGPRTDPDLLAILGAMQEGSAEDLGTREIDGRVARGFHAPDEVNDWTIWADEKTGLPVRIELVQERLGRRIVMTDFQFDPDFDESLFSTTAPEGYRVQKIVEEGTNPIEQDLIEGLRAVAGLLDGEFPPVFEFQGLQEALREHYAQETPPNQEELESLGAKLRPAGKKIQRALRYVEIIEMYHKAGEVRYVGDGVKLGDAQSPVFWWLPKGSKDYRVIYGDLSVRDVAPDDLSLDDGEQAAP